MDDKATAYQSYLLRVWRADNDGRPVWRFSLQPVGARSPLVFDDVNALMAFLEGGNAGPAAAADWLVSNDG